MRDVLTDLNVAGSLQSNTLRYNQCHGLPSGTNLDTATVAGFYRVVNPVNGPSGSGSSNLYLEVMSYVTSNDDHTLQIAFNVQGTPTTLWVRRKSLDVWQAWEKIVTESVLDAKYALLSHIHSISDVIGLQTTLDGKPDVETGTFIPGMLFSSAGDLSVDYTVQNGSYTRIDELVFYIFRMDFIPTYSTSGGHFRVTGMPFTCGEGGGFISLMIGVVWSSWFKNMFFHTVVNSNQLYLLAANSGSAHAFITPDNFPSGNSFSFRGHGLYQRV